LKDNIKLNPIMKVSIIIPTINQTSLVENCISSFYKHHKASENIKFVIVDDGSDAKTKKYLEKLSKKYDAKLILKDKNLGFSNSVNIGIKSEKSDIYLLCNNDIVFTRPIISHLIDSFKNKVGIVGAKLLYPNNTIQHAGMELVGKSFIHTNKHSKHNTWIANVDKYNIVVTGALMGISHDCVKSIGLFNEDYYLSCEDTEYCLRAWINGYKVLYNHNIEAIHIEGYTRGNNNQSKKLKNKEWYRKEKETISMFMNDLENYDLEKISNFVDKSNKEYNMSLPKLEIGCGYNPQPGYIHMDVRKLSQVDIVCNFEKDKLPYPDNSLSEILTNHVIEHISYRSLPFVLSEWNRVLCSGGRIFMRTPNLEFICKSYLENKTTKEWPADEKYVKDNLASEVTSGWWANIKLFAGQDYESNFHHLCFDFNMAKELLERYGFHKVKQLNIQPVFSPGELQLEAYKK